MNWLARWYAKRIVNVNVNIIVAGMMAMGVTVVAMSMIGRLGLEDRISGVSGLSEKLIVGVLTLVVDVVADLAVYYALHWLANHMPKPGQMLNINPAYAKMSFVQDATRVQWQRACLSPILYVIALGLQHLLLRVGFSIAAATAIGFSAGIATTRSIHTVWMMLEERHLLKKYHAELSEQPAAKKAG